MFGQENMKKFCRKTGLVWMGLVYAPVLFADGFIPRPPAAEDMTKAGNSPFSVTVSLVVKALTFLLFVVTVLTFINFVSTVSHGIEAAKKSEEGSMTVFAKYAVMAIVYLSISLATGYLGYYIITNFKL